MRGLLVLAALAASAPAVAQDQQFNLTCAGTEEVKFRDMVQQSQPYTKTYRIDLVRKEWCEDECRGVHPIFEIQPAYLILSGDTASSVITVDRITGEHKSGDRYKLTKLLRTGKCERGAFTGFSSFDTKF